MNLILNKSFNPFSTPTPILTITYKLNLYTLSLAFGVILIAGDFAKICVWIGSTGLPVFCGGRPLLTSGFNTRITHALNVVPHRKSAKQVSTDDNTQNKANQNNFKTKFNAEQLVFHYS
jgi:hypothetical protein